MSTELNQENENTSHDDEYSAAFAEAVGEPESSEDIDSAGIDGGEEKQESSDGDSESTGAEPNYEDVPEEFQNSQYYKSMFGRIEKERLARIAAEEKVRAYEASQREAPQQRPVFEKAEIPEELQEDVDAFKKQFPEFAQLIELKGREGDHLRSLLSEYGSNVAAIRAENIAIKYESRTEKARTAEQREIEAREAHAAYVFKEHPDIAVMDDAKRNVFLSEVVAWAKTQPYEEATKLLNAFDRGTAAETADLFTKFKNSTHNKTNQVNKNNNKRQQAIEDGMAVKSSARSQHRPRSKVDADDYSGAFKEACGLG